MSLTFIVNVVDTMSEEPVVQRTMKFQHMNLNNVERDLDADHFHVFKKRIPVTFLYNFNKSGPISTSILHFIALNSSRKVIE